MSQSFKFFHSGVTFIIKLTAQGLDRPEIAERLLTAGVAEIMAHKPLESGSHGAVILSLSVITRAIFAVCNYESLHYLVQEHLVPLEEEMTKIWHIIWLTRIDYPLWFSAWHRSLETRNTTGPTCGLQYDYKNFDVISRELFHHGCGGLKKGKTAKELVRMSYEKLRKFPLAEMGSLGEYPALPSKDVLCAKDADDYYEIYKSAGYAEDVLWWFLFCLRFHRPELYRENKALCS